MLLLDRNLDRLRWVDQIHKGRIMTLASNRLAVERAVAEADLVIGAVLVPGGRAPVVVTGAMVASMRTGAVIVDCAIDQGGCVEGIHETSHAEPVYEVRRRAALRGRQHPRRGAAHVDVRAHQRDVAVRGRARHPGGRRRDRARSRAGQGREHRRRCGHQPRGRRGARARVHAARRRAAAYGVRPANPASRSATGASSATATSWPNSPALRRSSLSMSCATW